MSKVFSKFGYVVLAGVISIATFAFFVWLPNLRLVKLVIFNPKTSLFYKLDFLTGLLSGITTNFTALSAFYTVTISMLFGINLAMIIYYLKTKKEVVRRGTLAATAGGMMGGLFGVGCAACGSFFLSSTLSFFGAGAALTILPLRGQEFGILSVLLMVISIILISRKIGQKSICSIK